LPSSRLFIGGLMPRLSIPLTQEQHTAIKVKAAQVGLSQAEVARRLLFAWLAGDVLTGDELEESILNIECIMDERVFSLSSDEMEVLTNLKTKLERMKEQAIE
jgi:hypothetical protein